MIIWAPKAPGDTAAYTVSWSDDLDNDHIVLSTLTVTSGTATIVESAFCKDAVSALISGGTSGATTAFNSYIETANGQKLNKTITLYVSTGAEVGTPSTATKRLVVNMAYDEVRLAVPQFQVNPDELNTVLTKLDMLMDEWAVSGIYLGYNAPTIPGSGDLEDAIGIPNAALHATALYLALRISPAFGKALSPETKIAMSLALSNLRSMTLRIPTMHLPRTTPIGQGNRYMFSNNYPFASGRDGCC